jgi:hypothetical protein
LHLLTRPCPGKSCPDPSVHTHHLTWYGWWHFIYRYKVIDALFGDKRPYPPIPGEVGGVDFWTGYNKAWHKAFPTGALRSTWVRDEDGYWVWVTDTPQWDRDYFDLHGYRFPTAWITGPSKEFYTIGTDHISTVVSLPKEKSDG